MAPRQRFNNAHTSYDVAPSQTGNLSKSPSFSTVSTADSDVSTSKTNLQEFANLAVQQTQADIARERHDLFNLVALLLVLAPTLPYLDLEKLFSGYEPGETSMDPEPFYRIWSVTILYFLVDLIWVARVPICVKSPTVIIAHHIAAIAYLFGPVIFPAYSVFTPAVVSVEINTWFLILRRVLYKRSNLTSPSVRSIVTGSFYFSWIFIRFFVYPAILVNFFIHAKHRVDATGSVWHGEYIVIACHTFLCLLNMKWSYDLFQPIISEWLNPSENGGSTGVANGL